MTTIITPAVPGVGSYRVIITRTGDATAAVDIAQWPNGVAIDSQPAASEEELNLTNIVVTGHVLTGDIIEPWYIPMKPRFAMSLSAPGQPESVNVSVTGAAMFNQATTAGLTPVDYASVTTLLSDFAKPMPG